LDKLDQNIIRMLTKNPRKSFSKIAEKFNISSLTVQKRYEKMKKENVIFGTSILLDLSKIGFQGKVFLFITCEKNYDVERTVKALQKIPEIFIISEIVGPFDVLGIAVFRDITEIQKMINRIRAEPSIKKVEVAITDEIFYPFREEFTDLLKHC